jgi:hypothetical protein
MLRVARRGHARAVTELFGFRTDAVSVGAALSSDAGVVTSPAVLDGHSGVDAHAPAPGETVGAAPGASSLGAHLIIAADLGARAAVFGIGIEIDANPIARFTTRLASALAGDA